MPFEGKPMTEIKDKSKFWLATFNICLSQEIIMQLDAIFSPKKTISPMPGYFFFAKNSFKWELTWGNFVFSNSCNISFKFGDFFISKAVFLYKIFIRIRIRAHLPRKMSSKLQKMQITNEF
jgi:hypothetical protein